MAKDSFKVKKSLNVEPISSPTLDQDGDIAVDSATNQLKVRLNSTTDSAVLEAATQTLTNKTLTAPTIDVVTLDGQASAPSNPSAGYYKVYVDDTTSKLQLLDSSGTVTTVGSGSGGAQNFITNGDAEAATTGWATYADAAGTSPVDGTGGSPTVTWTRSTSSPLTGLASFLFTKDAANRQGEGASYDFDIERADQAKVCRIDFDYEVASGTYADGDLTVWLYDVTNAQLIQPSASSILNAIGPQKKQPLSFQTNSNSTSYRLIIHVASTSASAYTVKFDNVSVVRESISQGTVVTELPVKTLTVGAVTSGPTKGATTLDTVRTTKVGADAVIEIDYQQSTVGAAAGTGIYLFTLPNSLVLDASKISHSVTITADEGNVTGYIGSGQIQRNGAHGGTVHAFMYDTTRFYLRFAGGLQDTTGTTVSADAGNAFSSSTVVTFAHNLTISLKLRVPILGWSSSQQLSSDADTRVVAASYGMSASSTSTVIAASDTLLDFDTKIEDSHGAVTTGASWKYTAPVPGLYKMRYSVTGTGLTGDLAIIGSVYRNGAKYREQYREKGNTTSSRVPDFTFEFLVPLKAGEYFAPYIYSSTSNTIQKSVTYNWIDIERISGPAQIAANEQILVKAQNGAGTSFTGGAGYTDIPFATEVYDSHGSFATPLFTAPAPGYYEMTVNLYFGAVNLSTSQAIDLQFVNNGTAETKQIVYGTGVSRQFSLTATDTYYLLAGQTLKARASTDVTASLVATAARNYVTIKRLGGVG